MKKILILALVLLCIPLSAFAAGDRAVFDKTVTTLFEGETLQTILNLEGAPAEGVVTYQSSAPHNAVVDENGLVTGVSKGRTNITATIKTEKRTWKASISLNVLRKANEVQVTENQLALFHPADEQVSPLLEVYIELPVLVLRLGSNVSIRATVLPADANDRQFVLSTDDESIVSVSGKTLRPKKKGECTLTVASRQNPEVFVQYRLLVVQPVTKLKIESEENTVYVGQTLKLGVEYSPETASIQDVVWSSGNEKIITVDENGVVTGMSKGSAYIKATAADGSGRMASYRVQVKQQPQSIELRENEITVNIGSYKTFKATVLPNNTNDKTVVWSSSDESIAKVNKSGRVTPVAPGTCTITCQSKDFPGVYTQATVHVHQLVTKVSFIQSEVTFNVGSSLQVFWETAPANATNPAVTFTSNNTSIATVDANGVIYGHKRGTCTITATAADGSGKRGRIKVNILQPVEGVHMKNDTIRVGVDESVTAVAVLEPSDASNTRMTWTSADSSIATVSGKNHRPKVTGQKWGDTTITGVTEDGGYTTTATIKVGNYDKALKIVDLYMSDNRIKILVNNESNMTITRFDFTIACYDIYGNPLPCTQSGSNTFDGYYRRLLYEGDSTEHGRFNFGDYVQPSAQIAHVTMQITGYRTDDGYSRDIRSDRQRVVEYKIADYIGPTPAPEPPAAEEAAAE